MTPEWDYLVYPSNIRRFKILCIPNYLNNLKRCMWGIPIQLSIMMTTITKSYKHINLFGQSKLKADSELTFGFVYCISLLYKFFIEWLKHAGSCKRDSPREGVSQWPVTIPSPRVADLFFCLPFCDKNAGALNWLIVYLYPGNRWS